MSDNPPKDPIVTGAGNIGYVLFGRRDESTRRRTYHMLEAGHIPGFKMGNIWCARHSTLQQLPAEREAQESPSAEISS